MTALSGSGLAQAHLANVADTAWCHSSLTQFWSPIFMLLATPAASTFPVESLLQFCKSNELENAALFHMSGSLKVVSCRPQECLSLKLSMDLLLKYLVSIWIMQQALWAMPSKGWLKYCWQVSLAEHQSADQIRAAQAF